MLSFAFLGQGEIPYVSSVSLSLIMKVILLVVVAHSLYMEERKAEKKKKGGFSGSGGSSDALPLSVHVLGLFLTCGVTNGP